jgi:hypothetical protein
LPGARLFKEEKSKKTLLSVFVFKDESEAQRQPLNFPTHNGINFGRSLFLLSLLLPVVCTHTTRAKRFRKKQRDFFTRQTRSISSNSTTTTREREREKKRDEKKNTNRDEIESRPITGAAPFHLSS